jgi:hypothetical protein
LPTLVPMAQLVPGMQNGDEARGLEADAGSGRSPTTMLIGVAALAAVVSAGVGGRWLLRRRNAPRE